MKRVETDSNGEVVYIEMTQGEIALIEAQRLAEFEASWMHKEKPFRVLIANETWKDWFVKKRDHADYLELTGQELYPDLMALLDIVKSIDNSNIVKDDQNTYVYLDEVFDYNLPIIAKYGAIVETKPIN